MPYYLHLLDRVEGAGHFEVSEHEGRELIDALRRELPGYLVPRLARESAGAPSKHVLA
jgi:L-lysine 2,3-aminomutase